MVACAIAEQTEERIDRQEKVLFVYTFAHMYSGVSLAKNAHASFILKSG